MQNNRGEMLVVGRIGETLGFETDGTTPWAGSAMHAGEARQIVSGVHDKPRLCGINVHLAPTRRTDASGSKRELVQCRLFQDKAMIVAVAIEQLQVFLVDALAYGMVATEIKRRIGHSSDFSGMVRMSIDRQVEICIDPDQVVLNACGGSSHPRQIKIGMIRRAK